MPRFPLSLIGIALGAMFAAAPVLATDAPPTFEGIWKSVNAMPGIRAIDEPRDIRIEVPSENTIYFFTKPGQPEYPAVFKRSVVGTGVTLDVQTQGISFGEGDAKIAFDALLARFRAQDAEIRADMQKKK
jgi:hypothetical protein